MAQLLQLGALLRLVHYCQQMAARRDTKVMGEKAAQAAVALFPMFILRVQERGEKGHTAVEAAVVLIHILKNHNLLTLCAIIQVVMVECMAAAVAVVISMMLLIKLLMYQMAAKVEMVLSVMARDIDTPILQVTHALMAVAAVAIRNVEIMRLHLMEVLVVRAKTL